MLPRKTNSRLKDFIVETPPFLVFGHSFPSFAPELRYDWLTCCSPDGWNINTGFTQSTSLPKLNRPLLLWIQYYPCMVIHEVIAFGNLRHFHLGTLMCIKCAFWSRSVVFTWMHIILVPIQSEFNVPSEVVWMYIQTRLYYYSWFTWGYACHESSTWLNVVCARAHVGVATFCSAFVLMLGRKAGFG